MKANEIQDLFNSFESIAIEYEGVECWSAREIAPVMVMCNGGILQVLLRKQKNLLPMPANLQPTILLTSAKWSD